MWVKASSNLTENVSQITTSVSTHLLITGDVTGVVDTSISAVQSRFVEELSKYLGEERQLDYVFLSHCHFDHVGGIPYLRKRYPELKLLASPRSAEVLSNREMLEIFYQENQECAEAMKTSLEMSFDEWATAFHVEQIARDGDKIDLGDGVDVKVVGCPGHTDDSIVFFVNPDLALVGGEALGGYCGRDSVFCSFTSSYRQYVSSLERLLNLDIRVVGLPHSGSLTGELAVKYLNQVYEECKRLHDSFKSRLDEGELVDEICDSIYPEWIDQGFTPEGPFTATVRGSLLSMIAAVAEEK